MQRDLVNSTDSVPLERELAPCKRLKVWSKDNPTESRSWAPQGSATTALCGPALVHWRASTRIRLTARHRRGGSFPRSRETLVLAGQLFQNGNGYLRPPVPHPAEAKGGQFPDQEISKLDCFSRCPESKQ